MRHATLSLFVLGAALVFGCDDGADDRDPNDLSDAAVTDTSEGPGSEGTGTDGATGTDDGTDSGTGVDPNDPCLGVSGTGCCEGDVVWFCDFPPDVDPVLKNMDCAGNGGCGYSAKINLFKCNGQDDPPDGVPFECPDGIE